MFTKHITKNITISTLVAIIGAFIFTTPLFAQLTDQSVSNLGDVVVRFCNENASGRPGEMKKMFLEAEAGEPADICIYVNNAGPTDVNVILNFVDGTITSDGNNNKACKPEGTKTNFGQFIEYQTGAINVPAGKTVETHATALFPEGYSGMSYGCVTMKFANDTTDTGMFEVISRRAYFVDFLVEGNLDVGLDIEKPEKLPFKNMLKGNDFAVYKKDDGTYMARLVVSNPGNVAQKVEVIPKIKGVGTSSKYGKNIITQKIENNEIVEETNWEWTKDIAQGNAINKIVLPEQRTIFEFPINDALSLWKGPFKITLYINHKPELEFVDESMQQSMIEEKSKQLGGSFFITPWLPIAIIAFLLLCSILIYRRSKKQEN